MRTELRSIKLLGLCWILVASTSGFPQLVVYENTGGTDSYATVGTGTPGTAGDLVTLAGSGTEVSAFTVGLIGFTGGGTATADLSLYFYNIGVANAVGSQIGSTVTRTGVTVPDGTFNYTFTGLDMLLPTSVIWAVSISNLSEGASLGWTYSDPPTVGSSDNTFAYLDVPNLGLTGAFPTTNGSIPDNLTAVITAVPEPAESAVLFGLFALAGAIVARKSQKYRADAQA